MAKIVFLSWNRSYDWGSPYREWEFNVDSGELGALRPVREGPGEPIEAETDAGALFELILSAGCRMPRED